MATSVLACTYGNSPPFFPTTGGIYNQAQHTVAHALENKGCALTQCRCVCQLLAPLSTEKWVGAKSGYNSQNIRV